MPDSNPAEKLSVDEIYFGALEAGGLEARSAYLDRICGEDQVLRARVERLLAAQPLAGSFLESPAAGLENSLTIGLPTSIRPGISIGPYKLLHVLGEGGMGVVFLAEQTDPVKRRVALKLIKPGMDTRQIVARFEAERQALALMDHPNIAKVLDCGTTEHGYPYFVMELVKGIPITKYCDENHLTPRQRLELFIPICQAVQHAHQKGIIHRDIKPSNILVAEYDQEPVPKIIDFGVAKALNAQLTDKTMFTQIGQVVGTLEYMSPEQSRVNQLDVDTRSDIYSLGVLLYELLTGATPFDRQRLRSAALDEMLRIIREEEPPRPSTRLSTIDTLPSIAANRHTEPKKLTAMIRGELDWIVMKALEKDRARRYETAAGFANDVLHYLNDEPVAACPPSAIYRFQKFARRNRTALLVGAVATIALIATTIGASFAAYRFRNLSNQNGELARERKTALDKVVLSEAAARAAQSAESEQRRKAETEVQRAKVVLHALVDMVTTASPFLGSTKPADYTVHQMMIDFSEQLPSELEFQPDIKADIHAILGAGLGHSNWKEAKDHFLQAHRLHTATLGEAHPKAVEDMIWLAYLTSVWTPNDAAKSEALCRRAISLLESQAEETSLLVYAYQELIRSFHRQGKFGDAEPASQSIIGIARQRGCENELDAVLLLAGLCAHFAGNSAHGEELNDQAIALKVARNPMHPALAFAYWEATEALVALEKWTKVEEFCRKSISIFDHYGYYDNVGRVLPQLGLAMQRQGKEAEFQALLDELQDRGGLTYRAHVALGQFGSGDLTGYAQTCQTLVARAQNTAEPISLHIVLSACTLHPSALVDWNLGIALAKKNLSIFENRKNPWQLGNLGILLYRAEKFTEALDTLRHSSELTAALPLDERQTSIPEVRTQFFLSMIHAKTGAPEQSQKHFQSAVSLLTRFDQQLKNGENSVASEEWLVASLRAAHQEAQQTLGEIFSKSDPAIAAAFFSSIVDRDADNIQAHEARGNALASLGQTHEAISCYSRVIELNPLHSEAYKVRAALQQKVGQIGEAIADCSRALELDPKNSDAFVMRAEMFQKQRRFDEAIRDYQTAVSLGRPDHYPLLKQLVDCYRQSGKFEQAAGEVDKINYLDESSPDHWYLRGLFLELLERHDSAASEYSSAVGLGPQHHWARLNRGHALARLGRLDEALADYLATRAIDKNDVAFIQNRAYRLREIGQFAESLVDFRRAEGLDPTNLRLRLARLGTQAALGEADVSQVELEHLLATAKDPGEILIDYGLELVGAKAPELMVAAVELARVRYPHVESLMYYNLGCTYARVDDSEKALAALHRSLELGERRVQLFERDRDLLKLREDPRFAALIEQARWGESYAEARKQLDAGDFAQAIASFTHAIQRNPKYAPLYSHRAQAYRRNGQTREADADLRHLLAEAEAAVQQNPQDWRALNDRGLAYASLLRWEEARADYDAALGVAPETSVVLRNRATAFLELRRWTKAADDLMKIEKLGSPVWQTHYHVALARLANKDQAGYQAACRAILKMVDETKDATAANFAAWTCCLAPDALEDWNPAIDRARKAVAAEPNSTQCQNTLGTILIRAGQVSEGLPILRALADQIERSPPAPTNSSSVTPAYTWYAMAWAFQETGQNAAAETWRVRADAAANQLLQMDRASSEPPLPWNRRLTLELFQAETATNWGTPSDPAKQGP